MARTSAPKQSTTSYHFIMDKVGKQETDIIQRIEKSNM